MRWVYLTAFIISIISGFYHWAIPNLWQVSNYSPLVLNDKVPSFAVDETFFYAPKVAEPLKSPGDLLPALMIRFLTALTSSTSNAFIIADFIFPPLLFLALFSLLRLWLKTNFQATAAAITVLVFHNFLAYFPYLPSFIKIIINYWTSGSYWPIIRSFHPQISLGLFFLFAATLKKKSPWWLISLLLTALTYTYFFYWTAAIAWLILFKLNKQLIKILAVWLVLSLPFWLSLLPLFKETDYWQRNYLFRLPETNRLLLIAFGFLLSWKDKYWQSFYAAIAGLITITALFKFGADDPIGHWFVRVVNPMTAVLLSTSIFNKFKWPKLVLITLTWLLLLFQFRLHFQYFKNNAAVFALESEKIEAFNWLKQNTHKNSVVATASMADSLYLPAYTNSLSYLKHAQLRPAANDELLRRFMEVYKLAGWNREQINLLFTDNPALIANKRFNFDACAGHFIYFRLYNQGSYYSCEVPPPVLNKIVDEFEQIPAQLSYPADYWLGTKPIAFGHLVWENKTYKIYALR